MSLRCLLGIHNAATLKFVDLSGDVWSDRLGVYVFVEHGHYEYRCSRCGKLAPQ